MDNNKQDSPWLPELIDQVRTEFVRQQGNEQRQRPALEAEHASLQLNKKGWRESLGKPDLSPALRTEIEAESTKATDRMQEIEGLLAEDASREKLVEELVDPEAILDRVKRLEEVLGKENPTQGNLELSLHIDKIVCFPNGKVDIRTCKLGALTDAVGVIAANDSASADVDTEVDAGLTHQVTRRRRGRLRVADMDDGKVDVRALADFAADPNRFAGLGEEWFWTDTFQIPEPSSWAKTNAPSVKRRYDEILRDTGKRPSLTILACEFGKSRPTIKAALDIANGKAIPKKRGKRGKNATPISEETRKEILRLHLNEKRKFKEIGEITGVHRNTMARIVDDWYEQRGQKRPDGRRRPEG